MAEDFDIFGNLKKLNKKNILNEFKAKLAEAHSNSADEKDELEFDSLLNGFEEETQTNTNSELQSKVTTTINEEECAKDKRLNEPLEKTESIINAKAKSPVIDENQPVARRTRRSLQKNKSVEQVCSSFNDNVEENQPAAQRNSRSRKADKGDRRNTVAISDTNLRQSEPVTEVRRGGRRGRSRRSNAMYARRMFLAEKAARATQIDYVDLVSSPAVRVEGFFNLDSDEEHNDAALSDATAATTHISNPNALMDEDNPEVLIKIKWKTQLETWKIRKYEKFHSIFRKIAQRENTGIENILINIENRIIEPNDTPDSIDYKVYQFLNGRILEKAFSSPLSNVEKLKERNKNRIILKVQSDKWKRPIEMDLSKIDKFRILYIKCAEELNVPIEKVKLSFDGEVLEHNQTPTDLQLEGDEIIDLNLRK